MRRAPVTHLCCPGPPGSTQRRQPQGLHQSPCPLSPGGLSHAKASTHWHILRHAKYRSKSFPKLIAKEISKGVTYYFMTRIFYFITEIFPIKEFPSPPPAVQYLPIYLPRSVFIPPNPAGFVLLFQLLVSAVFPLACPHHPRTILNLTHLAVPLNCMGSPVP